MLNAHLRTLRTLKISGMASFIGNITGMNTSLRRVGSRLVG
jgi:hypothetical protein